MVVMRGIVLVVGVADGVSRFCNDDNYLHIMDLRILISLSCWFPVWSLCRFCICGTFINVQKLLLLLRKGLPDNNLK